MSRGITANRSPYQPEVWEMLRYEWSAADGSAKFLYKNRITGEVRKVVPPESAPQLKYWSHGCGGGFL